MINLDDFKEIREKKHLIVLDTTALLELYRQPANISLDVINVLEVIQDNLYIPKQVFDEYIKNYHKVCGDAKKKYKNMSHELNDSINRLQKNIESKIGEYRKHNYTDISKLQHALNEKIEDTQNIIMKFENDHKKELELNIDFLENDRVKIFVDLLSSKGNIGKKISFSNKLQILQEGQVRFDNLIPPGYLDLSKEGESKYGDLFIWKDIISIAKEKDSNVIFVCNDIKEDWWNKEKDIPIDLRNELYEEFKEINPYLNINFLTLDKCFSYLCEDLKLGKSKSALQLSAMEDIKNILHKYDDLIYQNIAEYICTIDIEKELDENILESGDENIYWNITDVIVEKEDKNIIYYVSLDISFLADLIYQENDNSNYNAGKLALALSGHIEIIMEDYSTVNELNKINIEKADILHIEPDIWDNVKNMENKNSCKDIIILSRNITKIQNTSKSKINNTIQSIQHFATLPLFAEKYSSLSTIKSLQPDKTLTELAQQNFSLSTIKSLQPDKTLTELAQQYSSLSTIKSLQSNKKLVELAHQKNTIKPMQINSTFSQ